MEKVAQKKERQMPTHRERNNYGKHHFQQTAKDNASATVNPTTARGCCKSERARAKERRNEKKQKTKLAHW